MHELASGSDWAEAIDGAIEECDAFVLVSSRAAGQSPYVRRERGLATRLGRLQVAVLAGRAGSRSPVIASYDLRSRFKRGADRLASDLVSGTPVGWRPHVQLPCPVGALVVGFAPALSVVLAVVLMVLFLDRIVGQVPVEATHVGLRLALVGTMLALVGLPPAWLLWAFIRRSVSWLYLRASLLAMPLIGFSAVAMVEQTASALTSDAIVVALGVAPEQTPLLPAEALAVLLLLVCIVAGVVTELAPGLCRDLRTGAAPRRIRVRHTGPVPRPDRLTALHSYRLIAADDDAGVADEIRRSLTEVGIEEVAHGQRDIVVLTDRTPVSWLSRDDLCDPLAVAATSVALPVRGLLQRFQWVDYRARRRRTLATLALDLAATTPAVAGRSTLDVPERLQQLRLPTAVIITEWTLYAIAALAAWVAAYSLALAASAARPEQALPAGLCLAVAPAPAFLATRLRLRRISLPLLVAAIAACWLALIGLGVDGALQLMFPSYDVGSFSALTPVYLALTALIVALSWRTLRQWLPRRTRSGQAGQATLGHSRGSHLWLMMLVPGLVAWVATGILVPPPTPVRAAPAVAAVDVCRDQAGLEAFASPLPAAEQAIAHAPTQIAVAAAVRRRTRVAVGVVRALEGYQPNGAWGAAMRLRLIAALRRTMRADRAYLRSETDQMAWRAEYRELSRVADELAEPIC